jgi:hypothetical protein
MRYPSYSSTAISDVDKTDQVRVDSEIVKAMVARSDLENPNKHLCLHGRDDVEGTYYVFGDKRSSATLMDLLRH